MSSKALLTVRELQKVFRLPGGGRVAAVDGVSLQLGEGEVLGLVGESGSGKSTLGRCILGLHERDAGTVEFAGEPLPARWRPVDFRRRAQDMQMVFQDPWSTFNPRLSVGESLAEPLVLSGRRSQARELVPRWLERVGLSRAVADRYPHEFSGGQRQRIGIARALINEPRLLVCDEPVSALDVSVQAQIINLLAQLRREMGLSLLFIAHDLAVVRYLSDRIAVMQKGRVVEQGECEALFQSPRHAYTRALLAAVPPPPVMAGAD